MNTPDWLNRTTAASVAACVTALIAGIALLISRRQVRQMEIERDDRRLDDKVSAILGERILVITELTSQVNTAVSQAQARTDQIRDLHVEAAASVNTLQQHREDLDRQIKALSAEIEARQASIETALESATSTLAEIKKAADQADRDVVEIGRVRELVSESDMLDRTRSLCHKLNLNFVDSVATGGQDRFDVMYNVHIRKSYKDEDRYGVVVIGFRSLSDIDIDANSFYLTNTINKYYTVYSHNRKLFKPIIITNRECLPMEIRAVKAAQEAYKLAIGTWVKVVSIEGLADYLIDTFEPSDDLLAHVGLASGGAGRSVMPSGRY